MKFFFCVCIKKKHEKNEITATAGKQGTAKVVTQHLKHKLTFNDFEVILLL